MPNYWYDHTHLTSPDPEKTALFYQDMFDAKKVNVRELGDGRTMVTLELNGARILIMNPKAPDESSPDAGAGGCGLDHFGIVTDNIEAAVAALKANGVQFKQDINKGPGAEYAFLWAPENVLIELIERKT